DGFDVEIIRGSAILDADKNAKMPSEREHVGPFIRNSGKFRIVSLPYGAEDLSHIHLSLDYREDADSIGVILGRLGSRDFTYEDIANLVKGDPRVVEKTKHIVPNEGYRKSVEDDRAFLMGLKGKPLKLVNNNELFKKVMDIIP